LPRQENGVLLGLVLCSGDLCSMLDFIVKDDFTVEPQVNKFGF
jgi:hypothetical protein